MAEIKKTHGADYGFMNLTLSQDESQPVRNDAFGTFRLSGPNVIGMTEKNFCKRIKPTPLNEKFKEKCAKSSFTPDEKQIIAGLSNVSGQATVGANKMAELEAKSKDSSGNNRVRVGIHVVNDITLVADIDGAGDPTVAFTGMGASSSGLETSWANFGFHVSYERKLFSNNNLSVHAGVFGSYNRYSVKDIDSIKNGDNTGVINEVNLHPALSLDIADPSTRDTIYGTATVGVGLRKRIGEEGTADLRHPTAKYSTGNVPSPVAAILRGSLTLFKYAEAFGTYYLNLYQGPHQATVNDRPVDVKEKGGAFEIGVSASF